MTVWAATELYVTHPSWACLFFSFQFWGQKFWIIRSDRVQQKTMSFWPLTLNRLVFSGVEGCSRLSSVWGSCTFSMPAPSSSFFSRAQYARPSAAREREKIPVYATFRIAIQLNLLFKIQLDFKPMEEIVRMVFLCVQLASFVGNVNDYCNKNSKLFSHS